MFDDETLQIYKSDMDMKTDSFILSKRLSTKWNNAYIKSRIHEAWLNKCAVITSILEQLCLSSEKQAS